MHLEMLVFLSDFLHDLLLLLGKLLHKKLLESFINDLRELGIKLLILLILVRFTLEEAQNSVMFQDFFTTIGFL